MALRIPGRTWALLGSLAAAAKKQGVPLYAVGGCVRDWMLGRPVCDLDLVTEGDPAALARLCGRRLEAKAEAFGAFGTWRVKGRDWRVDFAAARQEEYPEPACLPRVRPAALELDLLRRDFTVNAMAARLEPQGAGDIVDPYGGRSDLDARVLRVLHPASFRDDPTRVFRAARFLCRFDLRPAPGLLDQARAALRGGIAGRLSRHRLAAELLRVLGEAEPEAPLRHLRSWGYLDLVFPDLPARVRGADAAQRLGSLALALGEKGGEFLKSLPVEHALARSESEAWRVACGKASPRTALPEETALIVAAACPGLPPAALRPLLVSSADLRAAGLEPGPELGALLEAAARAQWAGRIASRRAALAWLKRRLVGVKRA